MTELILIAIGFILLSGLMAMIEASVLNISRAEVEEMVYKKLPGSSALRRLYHRLTQALVVIVIATNVINILGPILVGQKAIALYGSQIIGVITAILTFGTIIFSEIVPKSIGTHYAPRLSRWIAPALIVLIWILYPIVILLERFANMFKSGKRSVGTEHQIRSLASIGRLAGHIESDEGQLIHRAFLLNDKKAADVMNPLKDIVSIPSDATVREAAEQVFKNTYSRYPIFGSSIHEVIGLGMSQDILEALSKGQDDDKITTVMHEALVTHASQRLDNLLKKFRDSHIHLAVVQDKGKTVGLVTLEDVLEELVGEIEDESDVED